MAQDAAALPRPVAFITGASSGIGAAAVPLFARAGYDVVLAARRMERLNALAADTARAHPAGQFIPVACDVSSDASVRAAFDAVTARFGRLDVLVNNAGFGVYGSAEETTLDQFRASMETNFLGAVSCIQAALPLLRSAVQRPIGGKRHWGASIVMVSSFVGKRALPGMSAYCASKFALEALSEALRIELHDQGIAVCVVNPSVTQTEFFDAAAGVRPANYIHPRRGMSAADVAQAVLRAARRPCRNRYLSLAGKSGVLLQRLAPRLFDRLLLHAWRRAQAPPQPGRAARDST